ncbi:MAG: acyl-CoA dehydrogenase family protein [Pseudomonadales bacterium]|nr:acyl-CoA dehydrogenase family protein [Pseudomonadales bacterium]MCP5183735.1 acyl-CoA dehydrogenase family protein [Pseudomonadales bacterium]
MSEANAKLEQFRGEARAWLAANFPRSLVGKAAVYMTYDLDVPMEGDALAWRTALGEKGWGTPTWPTEYGGGGLSQMEARVLQEEMHAIGAFNPIPILAGMGVTMVGPTVLEYGTEDQKQRHLPPIARGEVRWCLGYSEPNAGSDLASLATKAVDKGDYWEINGQKIWTSGADISQWCGALVRTDVNVGKRDGISFLMFPMDQPGVRTRPIKLIAGASPFCETFFDNARADKKDLLGKLNDGWSVGKRLLQHERQSQTGGAPMGGGGGSLQELAKKYVGLDSAGKLRDEDLRLRLAQHLMDAKTHSLTLARVAAESRGNAKVTAAASILKNSATHVAQARAELTLEIMGGNGLGWEGESFNDEEINAVRAWLSGKAMSIYGGSFEIQNNIISKNILGLPETTQKG